MLVLEIIIITPDNSQVLDQRWHVHFCWTKVDKWGSRKFSHRSNVIVNGLFDVAWTSLAK